MTRVSGRFEGELSTLSDPRTGNFVEGAFCRASYVVEAHDPEMLQAIDPGPLLLSTLQVALGSVMEAHASLLEISGDGARLEIEEAMLAMSESSFGTLGFRLVGLPTVEIALGAESEKQLREAPDAPSLESLEAELENAQRELEGAEAELARVEAEAEGDGDEAPREEPAETVAPPETERVESVPSDAPNPMDLVAGVDAGVCPKCGTPRPYPNAPCQSCASASKLPPRPMKKPKRPVKA